MRQVREIEPWVQTVEPDKKVMRGVKCRIRGMYSGMRRTYSGTKGIFVWGKEMIKTKCERRETDEFCMGAGIINVAEKQLGSGVVAS